MTKQDRGSRSREDEPEIQLSFSVREPHLSLCKMNISCIIRWSRMALQQETRATALSSSSHLLALPPSVSYSSCFRLSICLFFFVPSFVQTLNADVAKTCQRGGRTRGREESIQKGEEKGEVGEGQKSAWGVDRKLGHEEKRNKERSAKGVIDFVIFPLYTLWHSFFL